MPKEYGFGIVGAGMIAAYHADAIKQLPNARLVAVCDHMSGIAEKFGARCNCKAICNLHELVARDDIDVITVATPSGTHSEVAAECAKGGKHCIV